MKIGRNDPCPCGSGLKHKKCCLRSPSGGSPVPGAVDDRFGHHPWSAGKLASMPIEAIEAQLRSYQVDDSHTDFLALCVDRDSACAVADHWADSYPVPASGQDFLRYAACELWERLIPERPSVEMIDAWMQEGYDHAGQGDAVGACELWWKVWRELRERFLVGGCSMQELDDILGGLQSVSNWGQDFEQELGNAAREDRACAGFGKRFCEEWIEQFPDQQAAESPGFHCALAGFLCQTAEPERGLAKFHEILGRWPGNPWSYVAIADAYSHRSPRVSDLPLDLDEAEAWLRKGLAVVGADEELCSVLQERLEAVRRRAGATPRPER